METTQMAKKKKRSARKATRKSAATKRTARKAPARRTAKKKARRTVLYSSKGKKLYAKRTAGGQFKDIQQYSRAQRLDIQRTSKAEIEAGTSRKARKARAAAEPGHVQLMSAM
jgi:hypothetical protein